MIEVRLTPEQMGYTKQTLDKAKVEYKVRGNLLGITRENYKGILAALKAEHLKRLALKTKSVATMEKLYELQVVIMHVEDSSMIYVNQERIEQENKEVEEVGVESDG